jgi:catechol 2,3-dioxygenase-like lactoylglutathione lyase family enzyme
MTAPLKGLGALTLFVDDLPRATAFYRDVFRLDTLFEDDSSCAFGFGNTIVNLVLAGEGPDLIGPAVVAPAAAGTRAQLSIWVDDVDAAAALLTERGVALLNGPVDRPWGKRTACVADPDGNVWELAQDIPPPAGG